MKTIKQIISWVSFIVIVMTLVLASFGAGVYVANLSQQTFQFPGAWCLLNVIPMFLVGFGVELFLILGLKKFGQSER